MLPDWCEIFSRENFRNMTLEREKKEQLRKVQVKESDILSRLGVSLYQLEERGYSRKTSLFSRGHALPRNSAFMKDSSSCDHLKAVFNLNSVIEKSGFSNQEKVLEEILQVCKPQRLYHP